MLKQEFMSVTGQRDNNFMDSDGNTSEYKGDHGFEMNIQNFNMSHSDEM